MQGSFSAMIANILDVHAALTTAPTTAIIDANGVLGFTVAGTFSAGFAGNLAYLDYFYMIEE